MKKKIRTTMLFLLAALSVMLLGSVSAHAADELYIPETMDIFKLPYEYSQTIPVTGVKLKNITKMKSSKKAVASVSKFDYNGTAYVSIKAKKPGKTTVSFKYKFKGKTKTARVKVNVYKYVNPLKQLKIGSTNCTSYYKKGIDVTISKTLSGKLTAKVKNGWKLFEIFTYNSKDGAQYKLQKNNAKITVKKGKTLVLCLENKKTGANLFLYLRVK